MKRETWHVRPDYGQENVYRIWDKDDNYHTDTSPEMMDKRAQLMACAPNLLEACKTVLARVDHTNMHTTLEDMRETWNLLRSAVANTKLVKCTCKAGTSFVAANCKALEHKQ